MPRITEPTQSNEIAVTFEIEGVTSELADFIAGIIQNPPEVGGTEKYDHPLAYGLGFATVHHQTVAALKNFARWKNEPLLTQARAGTDMDIVTRCMAPDYFRGMDIKTAISTADTYTGLLALRSPANIGQRVGVFAVSPPSRKGVLEPINVRFVGPALVVDTAAKHNWVGEPFLSRQRYRYLGWENQPWQGLAWMADLSPSLMTNLYPGISNRPDRLNEGRGLIVINEQIISRLLSPPPQQLRPK